MTDKVCYDREKLLLAIRYLDSIVVSLDRVGSLSTDVTKRKGNDLLAQFHSEFDVFRKLSKARGILFDAFDRQLGDDDMDELERELYDNEYWSAG
jgi:hypothetical protein